MIFRALRSRPTLERTSLILALAAFACSGSSAREAVTPSTFTRSADPAYDESAATSTSSEPNEHQLTSDTVVRLIAKPGLWPLDVESAGRVLQALGPVKREQPTPNALSLVGGPTGALDRYDVSYSLDADEYWVFGSAGFFIGNSDLPRLYRSLEARLTELLGKPLWTQQNEGNALPSAAWDIGEDMTLSLAPSPRDGEHLLMIGIAEPRAEAR